MKHFCANCRNAERQTEADYYVKGKMFSSNEREIPYRAYLCGDCLSSMEDHDHQFISVSHTVEYLQMEADRLWASYKSGDSSAHGEWLVWVDKYNLPGCAV